MASAAERTVIRGWCPTVHAPMPSGDGLLMRVKPFGGRLSRTMLQVLAEAASGLGNGVIELTARGNLQIRGLSEASAGPCAAALVAAGLADPDPDREARRNVIVVPPADDALVAEVEAVLSDTAGLAPKFCVAVGEAAADVVVAGGRLRCALGDWPYSAAALQAVLANAAGARLQGLGPGKDRSANAPSEPPPGATLLHLPFGQSDAAAFASLAATVGEARTTPWRALLVPHPGPVAGFITDPADPRLRIAACPGGPACGNGSVPARADATWLASRGVTGVHVSGCAKGCAHPRPASATLVGRAGRYDLVRDGRADGIPAATGLTLAEAAAVLAA